MNVFEVIGIVVTGLGAVAGVVFVAAVLLNYILTRGGQLCSFAQWYIEKKK